MGYLHRWLSRSQIPLQWALVVPFVVQTLGIVGVVGYLSYTSGQRSIQKLAYHLIEQVDQNANQELSHYLQDARTFNQQQVAAIQAGVISPQNLEQLHRYLILQHRQESELTTLLFGTPQGDLLVSHRVSPRDYDVTTRLTPQELPFEAAVSRASNPPLNQTYAVDEAGNLGRRLKTVENIDVRDRPWYRRAVETGQPGWTDPFQIADTNLLTLNAYHPLLNATGDVLGVFAVNISLNQLSDSLRALEVGESGEVFILERTGQLIATSTEEAVYGTIGTPDLDGVSQPGTLDFERRSPQDLANPLVQTTYRHLQATFGDFASLQARQTLNFSVAGERYFMTVSPYSDDDGLDWLVVTVVPASEFMAEIRQNTRNTVMLCLLALGGAIASGTFLSQRIARHFAKLNQASQKLAQGDFKQTVSTDSAIAEVRGLSTSFNQVAEQLQDLFQRQVDAEATRQHEAWLRTLAASIPGVVYSCIRLPDGHYQCNYVSPVSRIILEREPDDITAAVDVVFEQIHPEDRATIFAAWDESAVTLEPFSQTYRIITPSGQLKWVEDTCRPLRSPDGRITWYGVLLDVSDRKAAEIALQASETRFRTVVDHAPDVVVLYDGDRRIQYVNNRGLEITGWPLEKFLGNRDEELFPPTVTAAYLPILQHAIETRTFQQGEATVYFPDQPPYTIWVKYVPLLDEQGEIQQILALTLDISERKQMEIALQNSEMKLLQAQRVGNFGSWDYDIAHQKTTWSEALYALHQIDPSQPAPVGEALELLIHPEDLWVFNQRIREPLYAGQPCQADLRIVRPSGEIRYIEARGEPIFDDTGQVTHFVGTTLDITERKQAELALQAKTEELDRFFSVTLDLLCIANTDGYFLRLNPQWEKVLGYPMATLEGSQFLDYVHPDDLEATQGAIAHLSQQNHIESFINRYRCQDGSYRWLDWRSFPVGKFIYAAARDITERQQMEAALRSSEARKQAILSAIPDLMFLLNAQGVYLQAIRSNAMVDLVTADANPVGKHVSDVVPLEIAAQHIKAVQQVLQTGQILNYEQRVWVGDRWQDEEVTAVPCEADAVLFLVRDISPRKRAEQDLEEAKESAEAANQAKSIFLANMSHELRTPLNSILGFSELMQCSPNLSADEQDYINLIYNSGDSLLRLINDILDLSKIESGKLTLVPQPTQLSAKLQVIAETLREQVRRKHLQVELDIAPNVPSAIVVDAQKLEQVLLNLLSNAIKFTEQGGIWLRVMRAADSDPTDTAQTVRLCFQVQDTGVGIDAAELDLIFDAFSQAQAGQLAQEGTGLGLAISRRLVQLMGGDLTVQSVLGEGSTFQFTVPVMVDTASATTAPDAPATNGAHPPACIGEANPSAYRMLVVDDQAVNRQLLVKVLQKTGVEVREAATGEAAIALWQQWHPHLIWMDVQLPDLSGYAVTRRIRAAERDRHVVAASKTATEVGCVEVPTPTRIIALTAQALSGEDIRAQEAGCDDYISKPFKTKQLYDCLSTHLGIQVGNDGVALSPPTSASVSSQAPLTPEVLRQMPADWRDALYQAACQCNAEAVKRLIQQCEPTDRAIAQQLDALTQRFEFHTIARLLKPL